MLFMDFAWKTLRRRLPVLAVLAILLAGLALRRAAVI